MKFLLNLLIEWVLQVVQNKILSTCSKEKFEHTFISGVILFLLVHLQFTAKHDIEGFLKKEMRKANASCRKVMGEGTML